ncbi:MAG TPA: hypothetical protein DCE42_00775 [Myxococcales bacterium]|nr:hypothetical protein [Deltaproteobacteria bacterium]HAA53253.1 hypothetical protein [Myxococcales bacterium]
MRRNRQVALIFWMMGCMFAAVLFTGCPSNVAKEGLFPIKVIALTTEKVGIPNARVLVNKKEIGKTDIYGTFVGTYRGKVHSKIQIRVEGPGSDNYMIMTSRLRLRKTKNGFLPSDIKVEAFLRGASEVGGGTPAAGNGGTVSPTPNVGSTVAPTPNGGSTVDPTPSGGTPVARRNTIPRPRPIARIEPRRVDPVNPPPSNVGNGGGMTPPPRVDPTPAPRPVAPPPPKGVYNISITANVANIKVYRGFRYIGTIRDAGGRLTFKHKDRRRNPRKVKIVFKAKDRYAYTEKKITKVLEIDPQQEEYNVEAQFEKRPPIKIAVNCNAPGAKVKMRGKAQGTVVSADQAVQLEYTGRPRRSIRVTVYAPNRKTRPRRIRKYVKIVKGQYDYTVEAKFRLPEPPKPRPVAVNNGGGVFGSQNGNNGSDNPPPPPGGNNNPITPPPAKKFDGVYKIVVSSTAGGVKVYRGRSYVGTIPDANGSLEITHKTRRKNPRPVKITMKAKKRGAFKVSRIIKKVALRYGQADGYREDFSFEKRPPITISAMANVKGVKIKMNGKSAGTVVEAGQAVPLEYTGRPRGTIRIEFLAPNSQYRPRRVRRRIRIKRGVFEYNAKASFEEFVNDKPINARCFRRTRGRKRIVMLKAPARTPFILKGECNGENVGRANKKGYLRVKMPVGTFQRVIAKMSTGSVQKVFNVTKGSTAMTVRFVSAGKGCVLSRIRKKIRNKIFLEEEEVSCLRNVKKAHKEYFISHLYLGRFYCQKKAYTSGKSALMTLYRDPRNRYNPYRAMQMGLEYARCKDYRTSIRLLKQAERMRNRFSAADKYRNSKALFRGLGQVYEQRYYRGKNILDLRRSLASFRRLSEITRSGDGGAKRQALAEMARIKKLLSERGGLEE